MRKRQLIRISSFRCGSKGPKAKNSTAEADCMLCKSSKHNAKHSTGNTSFPACQLALRLALQWSLIFLAIFIQCELFIALRIFGNICRLRRSREKRFTTRSRESIFRLFLSIFSIVVNRFVCRIDSKDVPKFHWISSTLWNQLNSMNHRIGRNFPALIVNRRKSWLSFPDLFIIVPFIEWCKKKKKTQDISISQSAFFPFVWRICKNILQLKIGVWYAFLVEHLIFLRHTLNLLQFIAFTLLNKFRIHIFNNKLILYLFFSSLSR